MLSACAGGKTIGSVVGGECGLFPAPKVQPYGMAQIDQNWIDDVVESGVGGCKWERPKARPRPTPVKVEAVAPVKPAAKRRFLERWRGT